MSDVGDFDDSFVPETPPETGSTEEASISVAETPPHEIPPVTPKDEKMTSAGETSGPPETKSNVRCTETETPPQAIPQPKNIAAAILNHLVPVPPKDERMASAAGTPSAKSFLEKQMERAKQKDYSSRVNQNVAGKTRSSEISKGLHVVSDCFFFFLLTTKLCIFLIF